MLQRMFELFKDRKIPYKEIGEVADIASSTISAWKHGESVPNLPKMIAIADYLGVSLDYLTGRDQYSPAYAEDERELLNIYATLPTSGKVAILKEAYKQKKQANENEREKDAQEKR